MKKLKRKGTVYLVEAFSKLLNFIRLLDSKIYKEIVFLEEKETNLDIEFEEQNDYQLILLAR